MGKKGQAQRIFVFIIMVIVFGSIMLFGYNSISDLADSGSQVQMIQLRSSLENDIAGIMSDYGSVDIKQYALPENIGEICFVDLSKNEADGMSVGLAKQYPLIEDQIVSSTENNLFIFDGDGVFLEALKVSDLTIGGPGWACYQNNNGRLELEVEGRGSATLIGGEYAVTGTLQGDELLRLELPQMEGLILQLRSADSNLPPTPVKLFVDEGADSSAVSDRILVDINPPEGTTSIDFVDADSFIQIPIDCVSAGHWGNIPRQPDCSGYPRYTISSAP